jgi:NADP-dependent 3-hydroxy acid dehydrogenase YdfG
MSSQALSKKVTVNDNSNRPGERIVLITGCSSGIGRALAHAFRDAGARVFATARRKESVEELIDEGFDSLLLDVTSADSAGRAIQEVKKITGRIDVLVNNAGHSLFGPLSETPIDKVQQVFETNTLCQLAVCQDVIPLMMSQGSGCIVNIGSTVGMTPTPFVGAYAASKAALHTFSDVLRMELEPFGIQVVCIWRSM